MTSPIKQTTINDDGISDSTYITEPSIINPNKCKNCEGELEDNQNFCHLCGTPKL